MNLARHLRRGALVMLKHTLNPLTLRLARASVGPFSIVQHVGRHSGRRYETPIIVSRLADGFMIELTYGPDVDWHKNVLAAGGGTLVWRGRTYAIDTITPVDAAAGRAAFPPPERLILRLLGRTHFERWSNRETPPAA